ncbi:hypothetical protein F442_15274 [Phytophthora nicotianae P10297]|nr:hypothetical protein F444_15429 [Phytophthora nicotianae P1976]ETP36865.1 hypothetical protein F442_15274 [Phytophthora nicotianae P10297]
MRKGIDRIRTRKFSRACVGTPRRGFFATMYATKMRNMLFQPSDNHFLAE